MIYKLSAKAKKRLLKLRDLLLKDAKRKRGVMFDMTDWGTSDSPNFKMDCGTKACALGLAAISGEFRRQGLGFKVEPNYGGDGPGEALYGINITLKGKDLSPYTIGEEVFDIPQSLSQYLFGGGITPSSEGGEAEKQLAEVIKNVVKIGEWNQEPRW